MKKIHVGLKDNPYEIIIGCKILSNLGERIKSLQLGSDALVVTHPFLEKLYGKIIAESLRDSGFSVKFLTVPEGEKSKSFQAAFQTLNQLARYDVFKNVFIVALGGGVIGDLAGFIAAIYKRGIPYVQVPTTLLAQIDSAIGGKTAVDLPVGKNLAGAFYQPRLVFSDAAVLSTLSTRQMRNGLAESVKYGAIDDGKLFQFMEDNYSRLLEKDMKALLFLIERCSQIKAKIVMADEKETKGIRTILNFGHTIGHAIEAAGKFLAYQHGEAIALGMRIAGEMSHQLESFPQKDLGRLNGLLTGIGLPASIRKIRMPLILRMMRHDKKFKGGETRFVLIQKLGKVVVRENIPSEIIKKTIQKFMGNA